MQHLRKTLLYTLTEVGAIQISFLVITGRLKFLKMVKIKGKVM